MTPEETKPLVRITLGWLVRKSMKAGLGLLVLVLISLVLVSPVVADAGVEVNGSHIRNYIAVNGTTVISFWVQSEAAVSSVALSYIDQKGEPACATMSLTKGDGHDGWWEATIKPNVLEEEIDGGARYRLDVRNLHVSLGGKIIELDMSERLGSWSRQQEILFPLLTVAGMPIALSVVAIVLMRHHQEKKDRMGYRVREGRKRRLK